MAASVAHVHVAESASATSILVNMVEAAVVGDLYVCFVTGPAVAAPATPPDGTWHLHKSQVGYTGGEGVGVFYHVVDGNEPASYTFAGGSGAASRMTAELLLVSGADLVTPFDATPAGGNSAAAGTYTEPSITTGNANALALHCVELHSATSATPVPPAPLTNNKVADSTGTGRRMQVYTEARPTAGSIGTRDWTLTGSSVQWTSVTLAIKAGGAAPPATGTASATWSITATASGAVPGAAGQGIAYAPWSVGASAIGSGGQPGPPVPTGLRVTVISSTELDVDWDDMGASVSGYDVERDGVVIIFGHPTTHYPDTGRSPATQYTYRVRSVGVSGVTDSPWIDATIWDGAYLWPDGP